ncbi:MAG: hypothetical protein KDA25_06705 [Phycisphaerales bacterium]|nr:hypothetical protein [Phycisphaerales bacterium]
MTGRFGRLGVLTGAVTLGLVLAGCEDDHAAQRAATQKTLDDITLRFRHIAEAGGIPTSASREQAMRKIVQDVRGLTGEPGQEAAALLFEANAHREIASILTRRLAAMESDHRFAIAEVDRAVSAMRAIDSAAARSEAADGTNERDMLGADRQLVQTMAQALDAANAAMTRQITPLRDQNRSDIDQITALERQENTLRRDATSKGPADGFSEFQDAIEIAATANRLRHEVDLRQNTLNGLEPDLNLINAQSDAMRTWLTQIDATERDIDQMVASFNEQARDARTTLGAARQRVESTLAEIARQYRDGEFKTLYAEAMAEYDAAAAAAQRAAGKLDKDGRANAKLLEAGVHRAKGEAQRALATILESQAAVLQRIVDAGGVAGTVAGAREMHGRATAMRTEAIGEAKASLNQAIELFQAQGSGGREAATITQIVQALTEVRDGLDS